MQREGRPDAPPGSISVAMVTSDEADKVVEALESVSWADEVVVLDLQSKDGSPDVARAHGAVVHTRPPHPVVEPLRDEVANLCFGEWVLVLDPDERVSPGLARALRLAGTRDDIDAVVVPRMNIDFGSAPESPVHRYESQLRMYRRSQVSWPHFPNSLPKVDESRLLRLPRDDEHVLLHERNRNVAEAADRLMRYAPAEAQAMRDRGDTFSAAEMWRTLRTQFERQVIEARAWEEGVPGLVRAGILVNHKFFVWVAFWQLSGGGRTSGDDIVVRRLGVILRGLGVLARSRRRIGAVKRGWGTLRAFR